MSYTQQRFADEESEFPTPPLWLVWMGWGYWNYQTQKHVNDDGKGQVRHVYNLKKAKKYVSQSNHLGTFLIDWAIYHWDGSRYVVQYSGKVGEEKATNPLFRERVKDDGFKPRDLTDEDLSATIQSIMQAAS